MEENLTRSLELFNIFYVAVMIAINISAPPKVLKKKTRKYVNKFILSFQFALM